MSLRSTTSWYRSARAASVLLLCLGNAPRLAALDPWILVMDDGDPGTSSTGTWTASSSGEPFGGSALYARRGTYTFHPQLYPWSYVVRLHWTTLGEALSPRTRVIVETATGPQERFVNQRTGGGQWSSLGTFDLNESSRVRFLARNKYPVCVDAVSFELAGSAPEPLPPDLPPATPSGVQATASQGGIRIDWAEALDADFAGFTVHRSRGDASSFAVLASGLLASEHLDAAVDIGTAYYYYVVARDSAGNVSAPSIIVSATVLDEAPPPAPAGVQAVATTNAISLDWADSAASDLASYTVYRSANGDQGYSVLAAGLSASSLVDANVFAGTTYYYYVTALDGAGNESAPSATVSATVAVLPPPEPATHTVTLTWDAPTLSADGSLLADLAGFRVYWGSAAGGYGAPINVGMNMTHTFTSLLNGEHHFAVTAYDTSGNESSRSEDLSLLLE